MADDTTLAPSDVPVIPSRFRLQSEPAQNAYLLLYPEGMVKLSDSAAQILKHIDGVGSVSSTIAALERGFPGAARRRAGIPRAQLVSGRGSRFRMVKAYLGGSSGAEPDVC
jgi:pyrroloquinoline quinone biosynthesis protein D